MVTESALSDLLTRIGIIASGKSTLAKAITDRLPQFTRLSIDEIIFERHGLYGVDYPADMSLYQQYQDEADVIYHETLKPLLAEEKDAVLDRSFYAKEDRYDFTSLIRSNGGKRVLVYLKAISKDALWTRIRDRSLKNKEANSAFDITRDTFEQFWAGFEEPSGEGELVIEVSDPSNDA